MLQIRNKRELTDNYRAGFRDFPKIMLTAVNLTGNNLEKINLDESNLIEVNWSDCNLDLASFRKTCLCLSSFQNSSLRLANLEQANLQHANLQHANLENANLKGVNLEHANLKNADLKGANLKEIQLDRTCFVGAIYDANTIFDYQFNPEAAGMIMAKKISPNQCKSVSSDKSKLNHNHIRRIFFWNRRAELEQA